MRALYTAEATAHGGREGHVRSSDGILDIDLRVLKEMGGPGGGRPPIQSSSSPLAAADPTWGEDGRAMPRPRIALALGSGGLKGMAHIGVLRALEEAEIRPTLYAGSSAGALVAAAAAYGFALAELESIADRLQRTPVFQIDYASLLRYGLRAPALYRSERLLGLCDELFGDTTFCDLKTPLVVSTVDVETASPLWWGLTGLPDASIADAVYASCAMPGLLPPGLVSNRLCMDGSVLDPLALGAVAPLADLVIAVVLDGGSSLPTGPLASPAPSLWWHAQSIVLRDLSRHAIEEWDGPPLVVIRLDLRQVHSLRGGDPRKLIRAGYEGAWKALSQCEALATKPGGVRPLLDS